MAFSWMDPLLAIGYKRPLEMEDLFELPLPHRAQKVSDVFEPIWEEEKKRQRYKA
jgi:hypothetical protein